MISHRDKEGSDVHSKRRVSEFSNELLVSVMSSGLLPWWLSSKRIVLQCRRRKEMWVQSLGQEDALEKKMAAYSSTLA